METAPSTSHLPPVRSRKNPTSRYRMITMTALMASGDSFGIVFRKASISSADCTSDPCIDDHGVVPFESSSRFDSGDPISHRSVRNNRMSTEADSSSFKEILRRASTGDQDAWRQVVDAYGSRVYALLFSRCRDAELAEELTQSTFCTVVTKLAGYVELGKFEPWLFRIAMNRLRDEMRRRGRHALSVANDTLSSMEITPREGGDQPGLEGESQQQEESAALREAMENLAEADQEIMHLRHISGLSFKQIAEVLQQPLGTVLARHFRAFKRLREMLGVEHED
ncbi:MAG: hypothetical protein CMJ24_01750 [Phycisphaerae bacterium]|nr:hypothetical protein [Phycisphaerae bacterium]